MPSEESTARIFALLAPARDAFRSAVTDAAEAVRTLLEAQRPRNGRAERVAAELGDFAAGRIDVARFAELLDERPALDERALTLLERARGELSAIAAAGAAPFTVHVPAGGDLAAEVGAALAVTGRAFGAARVAELVRTGRTQEALREDLSCGLPFARWTVGERRIAPPLLVHVHGADLLAGGLAAYLDGTLKIVLVVDEPAPPAALARLITPGVFVVQSDDAAAFAALAAFDGPAAGALVPATCARFTHDPQAGTNLGDRLTVLALPEAAPTKRVGRASAFQQAEELALLVALRDAAVAAAPAPGSGVAPVGDVAPATAAATEDTDRLAAWLLRQTDLSGVG